jgi:hypothetical protein
MRDKYQCKYRGKYTMKILSDFMLGLIERLAEMFPGSDYQSRLEQYIANRNPQSAADVEHWERQYHYDQHRQSIV